MQITPALTLPSSHDWLGAFAMRLMEFFPDMSPLAAMRRAVACHEHASGMPPARAAERTAFRMRITLGLEVGRGMRLPPARVMA